MLPRMETVIEELGAALSALNMPTPRECPPDMVEHAYQHVAAALKLLADAMMPETGVQMDQKVGRVFLNRPARWIGWVAAPGHEANIKEAEHKFMQRIEAQFLLQQMNSQMEYSLARVLDQYFEELKMNGWIQPPANMNQEERDE